MSYSIINREAGNFVVKNPVDEGPGVAEWKRIKTLAVYSGVWKRVTRLWIREGTHPLGAWKSVAWRNQDVLMTVYADHEDLDIYQALVDDPNVDETKPLTLEVQINSGVVVSSTSSSAIALYASAPLVAGSDLSVTNNGRIIGTFGAAGSGSSWIFPSSVYTPATPGIAGGSAVSLLNDVIFDNTSGEIWAGGGGGGGGGAVHAGVDESGDDWYESIGGSGGGGNPGGAGGIGYPADRDWDGNLGSSADAPNTPGGAQIIKLRSGMTLKNGKGGDSGDYGEPGEDGGVASASGQDTAVKWGANALGGAGGSAVLLNGNSIIWNSQGDTRGDITP